MFVSGDGAVECLSVCEAAEVEALAPSVLVEIGCEVVVPILLGKNLVSSYTLSFEHLSYQRMQVVECRGKDLLSSDGGIVISPLLSDQLGLVFSLLVIPVLKVLL